MVAAETGLRLFAGALLILVNGFFVATEFALTRVRQHPEAEFDEPGLRRAWEMTDDLEIYLTSCQVGITASSIAVGVVAEPAVAGLIEPLFENSRLAAVGAGGIVAFLLINLLHLTHGEQTPTYLGVERTKFVSRYGAGPLYYFTMVIAPLMRIGDTVAKATLGLFGVEMTGAWLETETEAIESRAELRNRLDSLLERGDLSDERHEEILNALTVGQLPVSEVMIPKEDVVAVSSAATPEENLDRLAGQPHVRYPLVAEDLDDFVGVVYVPSVIDSIDAVEDGEVEFEDLAAPPMTLDRDTAVSDAIDRFQDEHQELALVVDDGTVVGLVTATDAFEAIAGELEDPLDERAQRSSGDRDSSDHSAGQ